MRLEKDVLCRKILSSEVEKFIAENVEVQAWLRKKGLKTKRNYARDLIRYLDTLRKNEIASSVKELYALAKEENEYGTKHIEILEELQEESENLPDTKARVFCLSVAIKSFYSYKGKNYQFPKGRGNFSYQAKKTKRIPRKEDIVPYLDTIPYLRNKVIVALETCFPVRLESLTFLKWKHFQELLEDTEKPLPHVFLVSEAMKGKGKGVYQGIEQHSFLTEFAKDYVLRWKVEYEAMTETKIDPKDPDSLEKPFLIALRGEGKGEALSYGALNNAFDRMQTEAYPFHLHVWRTYTNRGLEDAGIEPKYRDVILGHKPEDEVEKAYSDNSIERLREQFKKALKYLDPSYKLDSTVEKLQRAFKDKGLEWSEDQIKEVLEKAGMYLLKSMKGEE
jgi:integrase